MSEYLQNDWKVIFIGTTSNSEGGLSMVIESFREKSHAIIAEEIFNDKSRLGFKAIRLFE